MRPIAAVLGLGVAGALLGFHGALPLAIVVALGIGAVMAAILVVRLLLLIAGVALLVLLATSLAGHHRAEPASYAHYGATRTAPSSDGS